MNGLIKSTPDAYHLGRRYKAVKIELVFGDDGNDVNLDTWTLDDHFKRFGAK